MNDNTKLEIAVEIMAVKVARTAKEKNGIMDEEMKQLMDERTRMYQYDEEVIDKIINVYGKEIKK